MMILISSISLYFIGKNILFSAEGLGERGMGAVYGEENINKQDPQIRCTETCGFGATKSGK